MDIVVDEIHVVYEVMVKIIVVAMVTDLLSQFAYFFVSRLHCSYNLLVTKYSNQRYANLVDAIEV